MSQFRQRFIGPGGPELDHGSRGTRTRRLRGRELVRFLAAEELDPRRTGGRDPLGPAPLGSMEWMDPATAQDTYRRAYRELGVVLSPAVGGLDRLDVHVYRPLRDAAFLTARGFDEEVAERIAAGLPPRRAFEETALDWSEGFAMLLDDLEGGEGRPDELFLDADHGTGAALARQRSSPYQLELIWRRREHAANGRTRLGADPGLARARRERMDARRAMFSRCDADFAGGDHAELPRVVFATTMMIGDDVRERASRLAPTAFEALYRGVIGRFRTVTASLIVDG
jgi:hypothetical protein